MSPHAANNSSWRNLTQHPNLRVCQEMLATFMGLWACAEDEPQPPQKPSVTQPSQFRWKGTVTCNPKEPGTGSWCHGPPQRRDLSCWSECQLPLSWGIWDPFGSGNLPSALQKHQPFCGVSSSQWGLKPAPKPVTWTGREKGVVSSAQSGKREHKEPRLS